MEMPMSFRAQNGEIVSRWPSARLPHTAIAFEATPGFRLQSLQRAPADSRLGKSVLAPPGKVYARVHGWGALDCAVELKSCGASCKRGIAGSSNASFKDPDGVAVNQ